MPIKEVKAREVLDSRGNPTVEAIVVTTKGSFSAKVPSGASTGKYEAHELRDGGKRYNGNGVLKAVKNIEKKIGPKVVGEDPRDQKGIDNLMIQLDGSENKSKLGANAILGVSMAVCRAGAREKGVSLYKHIKELSGAKELKIPDAQLNIINGGRHAKIENDIQEFMIVPHSRSFKIAMQMSKKVFEKLKLLIKKEFKGRAITIGDEGGFVLDVNLNQRLDLIKRAVKNADYNLGKDISIAIDSAASEFYKGKKYVIGEKKYSSDKLIGFYKGLIKKFHVTSIEDGFSQDDWKSWSKFNEKVGDKIQIVGDDFLVTNPVRIEKAIKSCACNSLLLKVNQIGTVTEAIHAGNLAKSAGWSVVVSHRSGETDDSFIADFAVGIGADMIKSGAPSKPERMAKYNRIVEIEREMKR